MSAATEPVSGPRRVGVVPVVLVALALGMMGTGAFLLRGNPEPKANAITPAEIPVRGRQSPKEFGLPVYPTAKAFHSLIPSSEKGSSAYGVERGTASEINDFYRSKLAADGWRFQEQKAHQEELGEPGKTRLAKGWRTVWRSADGERVLTLLALDLPQKGTTAQVLLMWGPVAQRSAE